MKEKYFLCLLHACDMLKKYSLILFSPGIRFFLCGARKHRYLWLSRTNTILIVYFIVHFISFRIFHHTLMNYCQFKLTQESGDIDNQCYLNAVSWDTNIEKQYVLCFNKRFIVTLSVIHIFILFASLNIMWNIVCILHVNRSWVVVLIFCTYIRASNLMGAFFPMFVLGVKEAVTTKRWIGNCRLSWYLCGQPLS